MSGADDYISKHINVINEMEDHPHFHDTPEDACAWALEQLGDDLGQQVYEGLFRRDRNAFLKQVDKWTRLLHKSTWQPVSVLDILQSGYVKPVPTILSRSDGQRFFYPGMVNMIYSPSGGGKSWIALQACVETIQQSQNVVYVDYEDSPGSIVSRLQQLGLKAHEILSHFTYIRPENTPETDELILFNEYRAKEASLIVVDSLGESMATMGLDQNLDDKVVFWYNLIAREWAKQGDPGPSILLVDHEAKSSANKDFSIGSQRKKSALDGMSLRTVRKQALARGVTGEYELWCGKDRHGNYSADTCVGTITITPSEDDKTMQFDLHPPLDIRGPKPPSEQQKLKNEILTVMMIAQVPQTISQIETIIGGRKGRVTGAIQELTDAGTVALVPSGRYPRYALAPQAGGTE